MLRNLWLHLSLLSFATLFQVSEAAEETCTRRQIGLRKCSVDNCYQCTISNSDDYSRIPADTTALQLFFSSETGLGPSARLPALPRLREIDLSVTNAGQTPVIPGGYFSGCPQLDVLTFFHDTTLAVSVRFTDDSFTGLLSLTRLTVSGLGIRELPVGVFKDLRALKILDLSQNRLTKVAKGTFGHQRELNTLYLGRNRISSLVNVSFDGLDSLRAIDLHQNEILSLGSELGFLALRNLTQINLADNGIRQIDPYAFTGLQRLEKLYLEGNALTELTVNVFNDLVQLRELDLSRNHLRRLPGSLFSYLMSLENLYLRANKLEKIVSHNFDGLRNLKTLDLGSNVIRSVEERGFEELESVRNLQLNDNELGELSFSEFLSLRNLEKLDLRNNSLKTLTLRATDNLEGLSLSHLDLSQNPWNCNCDIYWLILWLQQKNPTQLVVNRESTKCQTPDELRNVDLLSAYADHNCPFPFPSRPTVIPDSEAHTLVDDAASRHKAGLTRGAEIGIVVGSALFAVAVVVIVAAVVCVRLRRFGLWDRQRSESINQSIHDTSRSKKNAAAGCSSTQELSQRPEAMTSNGSCESRLVTSDGKKKESQKSARDRMNGTRADVETTRPFLSETDSLNNLGE